MEILSRIIVAGSLLLSLSPLGAQSNYPAEYLLVQQYPHSARALFDLGEYYYRQDDYYQALVMYQLAYNNGKQDAYIFVKIGRAYNKLERPDLALPFFKKGLSRYPQYSSLYTSIAHCLYLLGRYDESLIHWENALRSGRKDPYQYSYVYSGMAKSFREKTDYTNSMKYFQKSLQYKKDFWTYYEYAKLLDTMDLKLKAAEYFYLARTVETGQDEIYQTLIRDKEATLYYRIAMDYKKERQWGHSREYLKKILEDDQLRSTSSYEKAVFWESRIPINKSNQ